jgi:hypothetical protein
MGRPKKLRNKGADEASNPYIVRKAGSKNQCVMCKKYGHITRTCIVRMRHDERQQRMKSFYRKHVIDADCNIDMVSCAFFFCLFFNCLVI